MLDRHPEKPLDLLVQVKKGTAKQGGQFGSNRGFSDTTDPG
jgi:hypothetical protein